MAGETDDVIEEGERYAPPVHMIVSEGEGSTGVEVDTAPKSSRKILVPQCCAPRLLLRYKNMFVK